MGDVFLAVASGPHNFSKLCVLKALKAQSVEESGDGLSVQSFLDEGRLAARLNHPNVVQTYEVSHEGERPAIVMEYLEGQPLHSVLRRSRMMASVAPDLGAFLRVLVDALEGLHYAHELRDYDGSPLGLVHRDFSPHNVFVTYEGQVKLLDFGIAKAAMNSVHTTQGLIKGKVRYIAPEQALGRAVDRRSDVFSAGVILWELLTGRRYWGDLNDMQVFHALSIGELPDAYGPLVGADQGLADAARCALSLDPAARFATARALQELVEERLRVLGGDAGPRALGRQMVQLFERERGDVQRLIERQLRTVVALPTAEYEAMRPESMPALYPATGADSSASTPPVSENSVGPAHEPSRAPSQVPPPPRRSWVWAAAGAVLLLLGGAVWLAKSEGPGARVAEAPTTPATSAKTTAKTTAHLSVRVAPAGARLFLDGHPVPNPLSTALPSGGRHHLRAEAEGFRGREAMVPLEADADLSWGLDAAPLAEPSEVAAEREASKETTGEASKPPAKAFKAAPPPPPPRKREEPAREAPPAAKEPKEKPATTPAPPRADCSNPFYIDERGIKTLRPECR